MRRVGNVLVLSSFLLVSYPTFGSTIIDINGSLNVAAEELLGFLTHVILDIISGQPTQPPLLVVVPLKCFVGGVGHHHSPASWFLNGYTKTTS